MSSVTEAQQTYMGNVNIRVIFARHYNIAWRRHGYITRMQGQLWDEKLKSDSDFISYGHKPALKLEFPPSVILTTSAGMLYRFFIPAFPSIADQFDEYGHLK